MGLIGKKLVVVLLLVLFGAVSSYAGLTPVKQLAPVGVKSMSVPVLNVNKQPVKLAIDFPRSGGTVWDGKVVNIRWHVLSGSVDKTDKIDIVLLKNNQVVNTIARGVSITLPNYYAWHAKATGGGRTSVGVYRIKMLHSRTSQMLAITGNFSIKSPAAVTKFKIITPSAGSTSHWCQGRSYLIRWETENPIPGTYSIDLFDESTGTVVKPIAASVQSTGSFNFNVPAIGNIVGSGYKLRFKNSFWDWKNAYILYHNAPYSTGKLYAANIGNQLTVSMTQHCPVSSPISIQLLDQNRQFVDTIASGIPSQNGNIERTFNYSVPQLTPGKYYVRVTDGVQHFDEDLDLH
ncbi:MAG: hypothetical protein KAU22_11700 [Desulfuromonadales bacterium]|nr:hypothetical protein [Desulfuromonadales bacterium]